MRQQSEPDLTVEGETMTGCEAEENLHQGQSIGAGDCQTFTTGERRQDGWRHQLDRPTGPGEVWLKPRPAEPTDFPWRNLQMFHSNDEPLDVDCCSPLSP